MFGNDIKRTEAAVGSNYQFTKLLMTDGTSLTLSIPVRDAVTTKSSSSKVEAVEQECLAYLQDLKARLDSGVTVASFSIMRFKPKAK